MAPRIEPVLPEPLEAIVAREMRAKRISRTHYFEIAGAFLAGYDARAKDDDAELGRLGEWASEADRRFRRIETRLRIPPPRHAAPP